MREDEFGREMDALEERALIHLVQAFVNLLLAAIFLKYETYTSL